MNEILIYGPIYSYSASAFFEAFNKSLDEGNGETRTVRINTEGGEPTYGWGMVAKILEHADTTKIKVDGAAYSWGALSCCYVDDVEALDVSEFLIHRAAYSDWFEESNYFTDAIKNSLIDMNKKLEKAFRNKVDVKKFEALKNVKVKDIFSLEDRINVFLSAQEAKAIGLISSIVTITPKKKAEVETRLGAYEKAAAQFYGTVNKKKAIKPVTEKEPDNKPDVMETLAELKEKHPALYAQAIAAGKTESNTQLTTEAVKAERERVAAWMEFNDTDSESVKKGIDSGKPITMGEIIGFMKKASSASTLGAIKKDSAGNVITEAPADKEAKAKKVEAFENEVLANLGVKKVA